MTSVGEALGAKDDILYHAAVVSLAVRGSRTFCQAKPAEAAEPEKDIAATGMGVGVVSRCGFCQDQQSNGSGKEILCTVLVLCSLVVFLIPRGVRADIHSDDSKADGGHAFVAAS